MAANIDRNKELVLKRLKNEKKWSYRELGRFYKIHFTTAQEIFERDLDKYRREFRPKPRKKLSTA